MTRMTCVLTLSKDLTIEVSADELNADPNIVAELKGRMRQEMDKALAKPNP